MISKKDKEQWKRMCKCGHTLGEHSYIMTRRCLRVMSCCGKNKCEGFSKVKDDDDALCPGGVA